MEKPKVGKKLFRVLTGVIIGSAVGSILGLTLAPKKGEETRQILKDKSMEMYLKSKEVLNDKKPKKGLFKRMAVRMLTGKKD